MRVHWVQIDDYKNFERSSTVVVSGLVILFGMNSAGKTNALEAVSSLLGQESLQQRRSLDDGPRLDAYGRVLFELEQADDPGHADGLLFRALVTGPPDQLLGANDLLAGDDTNDSDHEIDKGPRRRIRIDGCLLPEDEAAELRVMTPTEVRKYLCDRLIETGSEPGTSGDQKDRQLLARHLTAKSLFLWNGHATVWVAAAAGLPNKARTAAKRINATPWHDDDRLHWHASRILAGADLIPLGETAQLYIQDADDSDPFPDVVLLEPDLRGLEEQIRGDLDALHYKLWQTEWRPTRLAGIDGLTSDDAYFPEITDPVIVDPWLETRGTVQPHKTFLGPPWGSEDWCRVKPALHSTARYLAAEANRLAPSFVRDLGSIEVQVLPPALWAKAPARVRILFVERDGGERRELGTLGAGAARWIAASLRRAGRELLAAEREVLDDDGQVVDDVEAVNRIIIGARGTVSDDLPVRLVRTPRNPLPLYVIDEPEAHLHPRAVQSVRQWLQELSRPINANGVLVATHDESFFALAATQASFLVLGRHAGKARIRRLDGDLWAQLGLLSEELGCSKAGLLQHTRLAVIVEGEHDVAALDAFFGDELARSLIRLIPAHGDINIRPIFQSQLLSDISAHQAVVRDKGRPLTTAGLPKDIEVITLKEPDIIHYLDDRACQARASQFPGWSIARQQWNAAGRPEDLKLWCARQYDLRINTRTVRELAAETRLRWGTPPELEQVLARLKALASAVS